MGNENMSIYTIPENDYTGFLQNNARITSHLNTTQKVNPLSQTSWNKSECFNKLLNQADNHDGDTLSLEVLYTGINNHADINHKMQELEFVDMSRKASILLFEKEARDVNKTFSQTGEAKTSRLSEVYQSTNIISGTTEASDSVSSLSQISVQNVSASDNNKNEHISLSQLHITTDALSVGEKSTSFGSKLTGAISKLTESRTLKCRKNSKNKQKSVTWSDKIKTISFTDEKTYQHYKSCLLKLNIPNTKLESAAVESVLFVCDTDENISKTLIDIALKYLWVKLGCCPKGEMLYSTIVDFQYDERSFVLAFIEFYHSEKGRSSVEALSDNGCAFEPLNPNKDCTSQHSDSKTDNISSQASISISLIDQDYHSLSDDINSQNQNSSSQTGAPLNVLDFQIQAPFAQVQTQFSHCHPPFESVQTTSDINSTEHQKETITSEKSNNNLLTQEELRCLKVQALQKEQEHLKLSMICVLCRKKPIEVTLLPCGHFVLCSSCSDNCSVCPVCKKQALADLKTFLC